MNGGLTREAWRAARNPIGRRYISARVDPNELLKNSQTWEKMLSRAEQLHRDNWACKAIEATMVSFVAGNGLNPIGVDELPLRIWKAWTKRCDVSERKSFTAILREIVSQLCKGDVLLVLQNDPDEKKDRVASRIHLVHPARIRTPSDFKDGKPTVRPGNKVVLGVEFTAYGKEIGYWVANPGVLDDDAKNFTYVPRYNEAGRFVSILIRRPDPDGPFNVRSIPMIAAAMISIEDDAALSDSTLQGADTRSKLNVLLATNDPKSIKDAFGATETDTSGESPVDVERLETNPEGGISVVGTLENGSVSTLPFNTTPYTISHSGMIDYVTLQRSVHEMIFASVEMPYELSMNTFKQVNFSGGKLILDKFNRKVISWREALTTVADEIFFEVVLEGLLTKGIDPTRYSLYPRGWVGAQAPDPNPLQTAQSNSIKLLNREMSQIELCAQRGKEYADVLDDIALQEKLEMEKLGRVLPMQGVGIKDFEITQIQETMVQQ